MKMLIYVGDLVTDVPGIYLGGIIARKINPEITLLHVAPKVRDKEIERLEGEKLLAEAREKLGVLNVTTQVRRGNVAKRLLAEVKEKNHDIVVITATRIGGYPRKISVTRDILPKIPSCVLIAKNPKAEINRILLLSGGISASDSLVDFGAKFANSLNAKVTLLHVASNVPTMYTGLETIEETLEELLQTNTPVAKHLRRCAQVLSQHNVPSELKLKHGELIYEIVREIDREDYDLVIVGASGVTTGLKKWFLGNVTKDLIDLVGIPIMVVNQAHAEKIKDIAIE
jgi:nucleotide-binding universal stress UspA family protein